MAEAFDTPRRRPTVPALLLAVAALVAAASIAAALWRSGPASTQAAAPGAADWRVVGWAYAEKGDSEASAAAYRKAAAIEPGNAENWSSLAEALQTASTSVVPEASAALEKALALDPSDPRARYFLAVQKDLRGDHKGALEDWAGLLRDTPPGAPWRADLERTIAQGASRNKLAVPEAAGAPAEGPVATAAIPGPSPDQLAAAGSIPPGQQDEMARAMVAKLAARLAANPKDADGWIRLMRSRVVLNDSAGARQALRSGVAAFPGDGATQGRLKSAAAQLGLPAGG
jgi:cytochrome c-type biogenesis protein CcmH